jgi:MFS family permease
MSQAQQPFSSPLAALRVANYRWFAGGFVSSAMGLHILGTAVGWEVYARTQSAMHLGYIGLARALPVVLLALFAGHAADVFNRQRIVVLTQIAFACVAGGLAWASWAGAPLYVLYALLVASGCARSFNGPSRNALLPALVPTGTLQNAVTWNSNLFQFAAICGPLLAGWLIHVSKAAWPAYLATCVGTLVFSVCAMRLRPAPQVKARETFSVRGSFAGLGHIWRERTILGAITLDLFAVLLGGATALLPIYAEKILYVGPVGLGALRAAPFVGALLMGLALTRLPPMRRAGPALLCCVAAFGLATIVFGFSTNFVLSIAALGVAGAVDNVSVVIRHVLVQLRTPDHLRGRVGAVNAMFIECSNELGGFESGLVAQWFGPVVSVVSGGAGTIVVVVAVAVFLPALRRLRELAPADETSPSVTAVRK